MRPFELDLDVYQGPFDLLLSLVLKEEIDLLEVSLFDIISAYLDDMEAAGATGYWDEMTEFLLLMSLLVEIKSRLLLPGDPIEMEEQLSPEEARDQLLARLFEYSKFKAASIRLRALGEAGESCLFRKPAAERTRRLRSSKRSSGPATRWSFEKPSRGCSKAKPTLTPRTFLRSRSNCSDRYISFAECWLEEGVSHSTGFSGEEPLVQALSLFALLDLLTRGEIRVSQPEPFGDIAVRIRETKKTA